MAIEFHCPYCTAAIRVADTAAGKRGRCPKCAQRVMIPQPVGLAGPIASVAVAAPEGSASADEIAFPEEYAAPPDRPQWFSPVAKPKGKAAEPRRSQRSAPPPENAPQASPAPHSEQSQVTGANGRDEPPLPLARPVSPPVADHADDGPQQFPFGDSLPDFDPEPVAEAALPHARPVLPEVPAVAPVSYARTLKRRSRRKRRIPWVPIGCVALLLAVIAAFTWQGQGGLGGDLKAEPVPQLVEMPSAYVDTSQLELPQATIDLVLDGLRQSPKALGSKYVWIEFRGTQRGLQVRLAEGESTMFYRVNIAGNPSLRRFAAENSARLDEPRKKELAKATLQFFREWEQSTSLAEAIKDLRGYRDAVGLAALVKPLGYHAVAIHDGLAYRCVYEDADGNLYFLLPEGVEQFELRGRQLPEGEQLFSGSYTVKVTGQATRSSGSGTPAANPSTGEPKPSGMPADGSRSAADSAPQPSRG
ncbi:MAG: hypothetical protein WED34_07600 [Planctomycetales bacterium]